MFSLCVPAAPASSADPLSECLPMLLTFSCTAQAPAPSLGVIMLMKSDATFYGLPEKEKAHVMASSSGQTSCSLPQQGIIPAYFSYLPVTSGVRTQR